MKINFISGKISNEYQQIINEGFEEHSIKNSAPKYNNERLNWLLFNEEELLVGVLTADMLWNWLYIDELWVSSTSRGAGLGKKLLIEAEKYAEKEKMTGLWLWTQSWQAADFYKHLGFAEFATFPNFPKGHSRIGFRKFLK